MNRAPAGRPPADPIDRRALVRAHAVQVGAVDPRSPLSVGNGDIAFTADVTGLQTLPARYPVREAAGGQDGTLLATQSHWGWHSSPGAHDLQECRRTYDTPHGPARYVDMPGSALGRGTEGQSPAEVWLRANPHRLDLLRAGFVVADDGDGDGGGARWRPPAPDEVRPLGQRLEMWTGVLTSDVEVAGHRLRVSTACHPHRDVLAVRVAGIGRAGLAVRLAFPYGSQSWNVAADWSRPQAHTSTVRATAGGCLVERRLDGTRYAVEVAAAGGTARPGGPHEVLVAVEAPVLDLVVGLAPGPAAAPGALPGVEECLRASAEHWERFWLRGGAVDLTGSDDPRAAELQRRVVLSQFLTALHSAGPLPPQETGLLVNSWRGRVHLEMHPWHAGHFPLWGRPDLLERSLGWYCDVLPRARETAALQGLPGARWPKQVGPDGVESPSTIGPFLVWQQPHPVHLAELVRRARAADGDDEEVLRRWAPLVLQSAEFMAAFAAPTPRGYQLGPPLVPAQESYAHLRERAVNPPFELASWSWALRTAQRWRRRLGLAPEPLWDEVAAGMARPPVRDGVYAALEGAPTAREDHPSMLYALGVVPPTPLVDPATMRATLHDVLAGWDWDSAWGWDFPAIAMTAARLGEPEAAVDALLLPVAKNEHLPNGHNHQTPDLPVYLPGNGALLTAVALMAGGWDGDGGAPAPGFPRRGWSVRAEGLLPSP